MSEKKHDFLFSYSSMSMLIRNPKLFHKEYILGERELRDEIYFKSGELFHCFLLEPENFNDKFAMLPSKLPTDNVRDVINKIFNDNVTEDIEVNKIPKGSIVLGNYAQRILDILVEKNLYQSLVDTTVKKVLVTGDSKRLDKIINNEGIEYFNALMDGYGKTVVDAALVGTAGEKARIMMENQKVQAFFEGSLPEVDVRKEMELRLEVKESKLPFGLKGIIDLVRVDHENHIVHIVDFKTTSKTLEAWKKDFETSEYMYWLQVMIYRLLILSLIPKEDKNSWSLKISFPVIDKHNNVYVFNVSQQSMLRWDKSSRGVFEIADWHLTNMKFDLPYEYEQNLVML